MVREEGEKKEGGRGEWRERGKEGEGVREGERFNDEVEDKTYPIQPVYNAQIQY